MARNINIGGASAPVTVPGVYGYVTSPEDSRDIYADDMVTYYSLPETYDLYRYMPAVINQGSKPMCSACAACCNLEWRAKMRGEDIDLSEEYLFDQREDKDMPGMTPRDTFSIILKGGVPSVEAYKSKDPQKIHDSAVQHRIRGYARIGTKEAMKNCIVAHGPVYIALPVRSDGDSFWRGGENLGGHAVPVIGWDRSGFIIRNSWGSNWASGGYVTLPYEDLKYVLEAWTIW